MKIKTKYNIGDIIIYNDNGLKIAKIYSFKIRYSLGNVYIDYKLKGINNNYRAEFELNEVSITSKATKRLINKHLTYLNNIEVKNERH